MLTLSQRDDAYNIPSDQKPNRSMNSPTNSAKGVLVFRFSLLVLILLTFLLQTSYGLGVYTEANRRALNSRRIEVKPFTLIPLTATSNGQENNVTTRKQQSKSTSRSRRYDPDSRELNQKIVQCTDAPSLLKVLQNAGITKRAAGGVLNSVNFSTSFHRLARHSVGKQEMRAQILADPRFALLLASLAEAIQENQFQSREISNIGWALAKLRLPPPSIVMPMADQNDTLMQMTACAMQIRKEVVEMATKRRNGQQDAEVTWIPVLSKLSGHILDHIGFMAEAACRKKVGRAFQMQEYANLLWSWSTASRVDPSKFDVVLKQMMLQQQKDLEKPNAIDDLQPQEWSNSLWAIATAQLDDLEVYVELLEFVAKLMESYPEFCDRFKPQEMSNTVWSLATLLSLTHKNQPNEEINIANRRREDQAALSIIRSAASYITRMGTTAFKSQELSNSAWAMATMGFGIGPSIAEPSVNSNYVVLGSRDPDGDREMMRDALLEIVRSSIPLLPRFRAQELNNLAWSIARLVDGDFVKSQPHLQLVLDGIGQQLSNERRFITSQDIGTTLWSLATLEVVNKSLYRALAARLEPSKVHTYKPQELSNTVWALATADIQVGSECDAFDTSLVPESLRPTIRDPAVLTFAMAAKELMRRPHEFKTQEIKDVLWSFAKIGIRHPQLFKFVAQHIVGVEDENDPNFIPRGFDDFSAQGLGNMALSYARHSQLAADVGDRLKASSALAASNGRLAVYTTSYLDVGETLLHRLFNELADAYLRNQMLQRCKPQDLANSAWAFAVLGLQHTAFMEEIKKELSNRTSRYIGGEINGMTQVKGQEAANVLWALATLNIPAGGLIRSVTPFIQAICQGRNKEITAVSIANTFKRQELANTAWACAVFGEYPPKLMDILYTGLLGSTTDEDAMFMAEIHGDDGLQPQAIMTLLYVQAALDLSDNKRKKSLPANFPEGWKQIAPSRSDHMTDTFDELNLSTSKMQRAVSSAFSRIGFHHVEEHIITMEEMAHNHGINFAPKSVEILSIDIADVDQKIAIEVDGPAHFVAHIDGDIQEEEEGRGYTKVKKGKLEYQYMWTGERHVINGPTALKQRLLCSLGWKVIPVPFWEWFELKGDEMAENDYCAKILRQAPSVRLRNT
jgi:hypothetical protein